MIQDDSFSYTIPNVPDKRIRTLCFYLPFGSLMLHGKIETRWVREGRKPPFPKGKYVFYTSKRPCDDKTLIDWCGDEIYKHIHHTLFYDDTKGLNERIIGTGDLVGVRLLNKKDELNSFVKFVGRKSETVEGKEVVKVQWALIFENVQATEPVETRFNGKSIAKQGIGFLPEEMVKLIKINNV